MTNGVHLTTFFSKIVSWQPIYPRATISFWYRTAHGAGGSILSGSSPWLGGLGVSIGFWWQILVNASNGSFGGTAGFEMLAPLAAIQDGHWHHIMVAFDSSFAHGSRLLKIAVDGFVGWIGEFSDYGDAFNFGGLNVWSFGDTNSELAELYCNFGTYLDLADPATHAKFVTNGAPADLGSNGSTPTGSQPYFYFSAPNAPTDFLVNRGTGPSGFTFSGTASFTLTPPTIERPISVAAFQGTIEIPVRIPPVNSRLFHYNDFVLDQGTNSQAVIDHGQGWLDSLAASGETYTTTHVAGIASFQYLTSLGQDTVYFSNTNSNQSSTLGAAPLAAGSIASNTVNTMAPYPWKLQPTPFMFGGKEQMLWSIDLLAGHGAVFDSNCIISTGTIWPAITEFSFSDASNFSVPSIFADHISGTNRVLLQPSEADGTSAVYFEVDQTGTALVNHYLHIPDDTYFGLDFLLQHIDNLSSGLSSAIGASGPAQVLEDGFYIYLYNRAATGSPITVPPDYYYCKLSKDCTQYWILHFYPDPTDDLAIIWMTQGFWRNDLTVKNGIYWMTVVVGNSFSSEQSQLLWSGTPAKLSIPAGFAPGATLPETTYLTSSIIALAAFSTFLFSVWEFDCRRMSFRLDAATWHIAITTSGTYPLVELTVAAYTDVAGLTSATFQMPNACKAHMLVSVDAANQIIQVYINDVPITATTATWTDACTFSGSPETVTLNSDAGLTTTDYLQDLWFDLPVSFVDLTVEDNRRKFIDSSTDGTSGYPVYLGNNGELPFGTSPKIFLTARVDDSGDLFANNRGTAGAFSRNGEITTSSNPCGQTHCFAAPKLLVTQILGGAYPQITQIVFSGTVAPEDSPNKPKPVMILGF